MDDELQLGHGVRVRRDGDGLVVTSETMPLGLHVRAGNLPGTAVQVGGELWEVVEGGQGSRAERWVVRPWPEGEAIRRVVRLDVDGLHAMAMERRREEARRRRNLLLTLASPIVGFAPAAVQVRWENEHGYPAMLGVLLSSLVEVAVGGFGVVQLAVLGFSGVSWVPGWALWLLVPSPVLLLEGMMRLHHGNAHGEPVGSILGAPLLLLGGRNGTGDRTASAPPGAARWILGRTLLWTAVCFAPRAVQERWAERENVAPWVPTLAGAGLELLGGTVDLVRDGGLSGVWSLISLALAVEGLVRLAGLAVTRRPVGSLLGVPLGAVYRRLVP